MSQVITLKGKISKVLVDSEFASDLADAVAKTRFIVMREYSKEAPVLSGDLRRGIVAIGRKDGYVVRTKTKKNGKPYPLYVHEGTGRFKGMNIDFPSSGRVRSGESKRNRGSGGIRPNMFAKRARDTAWPLVMNNLSSAVDKITSETKTI